MTTMLALAPFNPTTAQESYRPPYSKQKSVDTIIIHADGTHDHIMESTERIESELGVSEFGERILGFNSSLESMEILEAYTISPKGERIKVEPQAIRTVEEEITGGAPMFSDMKNKVIVYPNIEVGSMLYLKAKSRQHSPHFGKEFFFHEVFSPHVRYEDVAYNVVVHPSIDLKVSSRGMQGGAFAPDAQALASGPDGYRRYLFTYSQESAYPIEPGQLHYTYFSPHLMLSTFPDYIAVGQAYERYAKPKTRLTPSVRQLADEITKGITAEREQIQALYHWVTRNIRYVAIYLGDGGFEPHDVDAIIKNRYGDCKDHVVILQALLAAKGIEASPALINSGMGQELSPIPVTFPLNHVILYLPKMDLYLDPTAQFVSFGQLPDILLDKPVVLTALNRISRTPKMIAGDHRTVSKMQVDVLADGRLRGVSNTTFDGSSEADARGRHFDREGRSPERTVRSLLGRFNEIGFGVIADSDAVDITRPFTLNARFELDPQVNLPGPSAMMVPVALSPGRIASMAHTKPIAKRRFPTGCGSEEIVEEVELRFADSINVTRIPSGVNFESGSIRYKSFYEMRGTGKQKFLVVQRRLSLQYGSATCSEQDSKEWHDFHPLLYRDVRAQIFVE
jgi:transglutaminase-like putative cysteine protease